MGEWTLATFAFTPAYVMLYCHQRTCLPGLHNLNRQCAHMAGSLHLAMQFHADPRATDAQLLQLASMRHFDLLL